jgi:hypothetical protein
MIPQEYEPKIRGLSPIPKVTQHSPNSRDLASETNLSQNDAEIHDINESKLLNIQNSQNEFNSFFGGNSIYDPSSRISLHHGEMVPLPVVLRRMMHFLIGDLKFTMKGAGMARSEEQKRFVLEFIRKCRLSICKLICLITWARHSSAFTSAQSIVAILQAHDAAFDTACFTLRAFTDRVGRARYRNFDIATAVDILTSGTYCGMPKVLSTVFNSVPSNVAECNDAIKLLDRVIMLRLATMECGIPKELLQGFEVSQGKLVFRIPKEFQLSLTLPGGPDPSGPWHILDFRILDPNVTIHQYQVHNLMRLGHEKIQNSFQKLAGVKNPKESFSSNLNAIEFPLTEVYHFYHHFTLQLRFERLILEAFRLLSSGSFPALGNVFLKHDGKCLELVYWIRSKNRGSLRLLLKEEERRIPINISPHPSINPLTDPIPYPQVTAVRRPPVTTQYTYNEFKIVAEYLDKVETVSTESTLPDLLNECINYHTVNILRVLGSMAPASPAPLFSSGILGFNHLGEEKFLPKDIHEMQSLSAIMKQFGNVISTPFPFICQGTLYIPKFLLQISVHTHSGKFHVSPLDKYHDKFLNVETAINQDPAFLRRSLSNLATSLVLDQVETSVTFLGFTPSSLLPGTCLAIGANTPVELGPKMFLRMLHLQTLPDYHVAFNSMNGSVSCWVIHWYAEKMFQK